MTIEQLIALAQAGTMNTAFFAELFILLHQHRYTDLEAILLRCPEASRQTDWYRLYAKCLLIQNRYEETLASLSQVPVTDRRLVIGDLLLCYEKLLLIDEGIAFIDERLAIQFQMSLYLKKIQLLNRSSRYEEVLASLEEMLLRFPDYQELKVAHAQCLSVLGHKSFGPTMRVYNQAHPENIQLWMIQFWHFFHREEKGIALGLLMEILYKFPVCLEAQLALVKAHFLNGLFVDARLNLMFYYYTFKTQDRALSLMRTLTLEHPELEITESTSPLRVVLPTLIARVFASIHVPGVNVSYVVGSANHQMISGQSLTEIDDIDFVSNVPPLVSTEFTPSPHIPNLYSQYLNHEGIIYKCEYFVNPLAPAKMIETDVLKRDFTVNGIYCDSEGHIIDPTGLGLLDLQHRIIRSIVSSRVSINEDPIRILRAIKLMLKGFRPTPELEYAIFQWRAETPLNQGRINAVCSKLISSFPPAALLFHFKRYQILEKMFQLSIDGLSDSQIFMNLSACIESTSPHRQVIQRSA
jgi:tetratricopeptide (TPR) repeat protein